MLGKKHGLSLRAVMLTSGRLVEFRGSGVNSVGRLCCNGFAKIDGRCDKTRS